MSDFVNVLSDSRDRDTFAGYGTSVWTAIEDVAGDESFWMRSFGEDTVEVNGVEGESPRGCFLSRDSFSENSSSRSFAISSFGRGSI